MFYIGSGALSKYAASAYAQAQEREANWKAQPHKGQGSAYAQAQAREAEQAAITAQKEMVAAGQEAGAGAADKAGAVAKKVPWSLKKKLLVGGGVAAALGAGAYGLHRALSD